MIDAKEERIKYHAMGLLAKMGVHKKTTLPSVWNLFLRQTMMLLAQGYTEKYIQLNLEELATYRLFVEKEKRVV